jgi:hypothetical protein
MTYQEIISNVKRLGLEFVGLYYSSYPGYVVNNNDPLGLNRVQIVIPQLVQKCTVDQWALAKNNPSGKGWGSQCLPRAGDMVWVTFQLGQLKYPMWEHYYPLKGEKPEDFKNPNIFGFISPRKQKIILDDNEEYILVKTKTLHLEADEYAHIKTKKHSVESDDVNLGGVDASYKVPLGQKLDEDITTLKNLVVQMQGMMATMGTSAAAVCSAVPTSPIAPLAAPFSSLASAAASLTPTIAGLEEHLASGYHLSDKTKTN